MNERQYGLPSDEPAPSRRAWWYPPLAFGHALLVSWWITQRLAMFWGYHASLGSPVWGTLYAPWNWFVWWRQYPEAADDIVSQGFLAFMLPQFLLLFLASWLSRKPKGRDDLHGSAHWAVKEDIEAAGLFGKGVYVGGWQDGDTLRYLRHDGPEHIMAFAPTRSGKGVGLVLPTLLSWPASSVVLDIKGENYALTSGWRHSQGHRILRFDPSDMSGTSTCFNPLEEVRLETLYAVSDVQNLAHMIIDPDGKGLQDHWGKAGFAFICGVLLHSLVFLRHRRKGKQATLYDLGNMLSDENKTSEELLEEMLEEDHEKLMGEMFPHGSGNDKIHTFIAASAREMLNKDGKEASGVLSTAILNLSLYRDPIVAMNTDHSDFRIADLMHDDAPVTLYIVISPAHIDRVNPLTRLIMNSILRRLIERMEFENGKTKAGYKHRLLLLLDEFTSLGKLEIFEKAMAYMAGYGVIAYIFIQNVTQLNAVYGKDNSLMANCHIRIAYAPNTPETAELLSKMTGTTTVVEQKTSLSGARMGSLKNASVSITETARPLLTPDEVGRLPKMVVKKGKVLRGGDMLIFVAGFPAIYGRQSLFFLDPVFLKRSKIPAPDALFAGNDVSRIKLNEANSTENHHVDYTQALARAGADSDSRH